MEASHYALTLECGTDEELPLSWRTTDGSGHLVPVDLTGWEARAEVRDGKGTAVVSLTSDAGIALSSQGLIVLSFPAAATGPLAGKPMGDWDLMLKSPTEKLTRLLRGPVTFKKGSLWPTP